MKTTCFGVLMFMPLALWAQQTTGLFHFDVQAQDGYTLFAPLLNGHQQYLLNNCGEVVHSWNSPGLAPANSMYLLEDGTLVYPAIADTATSHPIAGGGAGERIIKKDWDGNILWDYIYYDETTRLHHDIEVLPNGNVLAIAWVLVDSADCIAAGRNPNRLSSSVLWTERIIEVEPTGPNTGNVVWQWDIWDHLVQDFDATKDNFGIVGNHPELLDINWLNTFIADSARDDFIHLNSVDYNSELDQIVLSSQVHSEIWIIDHSTTTEEAASHSGGVYGMGGDILYRYGNPQVYDRGTAADQKIWRQHDANWIAEGRPDAGGIMIFNNGLDRSPGFSEIDVINPPQAAPGVYELNTGNAYGPATTSWNYHAEDSTSFFSYFISGATRLPNGNTMICEGESGHIFEITYDGEVVWSYVNPVTQWSVLGSTETIPLAGGGSFHSNMVFRAEKYSSDYPAFDGKDLSNGTQLETNPIISSCVVSVNDHITDLDFDIYPNPTTGLVTVAGLFDAQLTIYNMAGSIVRQMKLASNNEILDFSGIARGLYTLRILSSGGEHSIRKLVIQ